LWLKKPRIKTKVARRGQLTPEYQKKLNMGAPRFFYVVESILIKRLVEQDGPAKLPFGFTQPDFYRTYKKSRAIANYSDGGHSTERPPAGKQPPER